MWLKGRAPDPTPMPSRPNPPSTSPATSQPTNPPFPPPPPWRVLVSSGITLPTTTTCRDGGEVKVDSGHVGCGRFDCGVGFAEGAPVLVGGGGPRRSPSGAPSWGLLAGRRMKTIITCREIEMTDRYPLVRMNQSSSHRTRGLKPNFMAEPSIYRWKLAESALPLFLFS